MGTFKMEGNTLDDEIMEQYDAEQEEEKELKTVGQWTVEDVCCLLYGGFANYSEPLKAMEYSDVTSPLYRGGDWWEQWKQEHWVGRKGMQERFGLLPEEGATGAEI